MNRKSGCQNWPLNCNQRGHALYSLAQKKRLTPKPLEACTVQGEPCLSESLRRSLHNIGLEGSRQITRCGVRPESYAARKVAASRFVSRQWTGLKYGTRRII